MTLLMAVSSTRFTYYIYIIMTWLTGADFEKRRDLAKSRFLHLISGKFIINLDKFAEYTYNNIGPQHVAEHDQLNQKLKKKIIAKT